MSDTGVAVVRRDGKVFSGRQGFAHVSLSLNGLSTLQHGGSCRFCPSFGELFLASRRMCLFGFLVFVAPLWCISSASPPFLSLGFLSPCGEGVYFVLLSLGCLVVEVPAFMGVSLRWVSVVVNKYQAYLVSL